VNATERREIQRATVLLVSGDRSGTLAILRSLRRAPLHIDEAPSTQLLFAFLTFDCERLSVTALPACICVTRQRVTDLQRTQQSSRGQGTDYPLCDSRTCSQGKSIRDRLDPNAPMTWRGAGPGGRFERERFREEK
jgi:hypothetical protein